jgi:O-antigen/teichoic acid export membrane protein
MKVRLTRGAAWLTATRLLVNLIGFASTIALARMLLPADFGLVAIAATIAAVIGSVTELSLSSALVQHDDPDDRHFDAAWTLNVARALVLAGALAALALPVAELYADPRLVEIMLALSATTLLGGFGNPKLVVFTRDLIFWQEFVIGVSQKLLGFVVAIAIAVFYESYWALIVGGAAGQLVALVLSYVVLPYRPRLRLTGGRSLLAFSVWLTLGRTVNTVNWRSDQLFIGYFLGHGPLGFYTFGDNLAALPTREATGPLAQTLFPAFSRMSGDPDRLREAYQKAQTLMCAVALPIGCGFATIAEPLVRVTVGAKWEPAVIVIQILASVFAVQTVASTLQPLAMAMGETRALFRRDLANLVFRFPLIILGLATGGLLGVLLARVASGLFGTLLNLALVRRLLGVPVTAQLAANGRSFAAVGVMALALGSVMRTGAVDAVIGTVPALLALAALITSGALVYVATLAGLWMLAGRPPGPETSIADILRSVGGALAHRPAMLRAVSPQ